MSKYLSWAIAVIVIAALVIGKTVCVDSFAIAQNGMYPALPKGSSIWVNKLAYSKAADVKRGDVVVYNHAEDGQLYYYIWRVIGLPGEHIQSKDTELSINGKDVPHTHQRTDGDQQIYLEQHQDCQFEICFEATARELPPESDLILGPDEFFLMGDNRYSAADNRYKGPVKFGALVGKKF